MIAEVYKIQYPTSLKNNMFNYVYMYLLTCKYMEFATND